MPVPVSPLTEVDTEAGLPIVTGLTGPLTCDHLPVPFAGEFPVRFTVVIVQIFWSDPAFAFGASVIIMIMLSVTVRHVPFPVVESKIVTLPAAVSEALGV